MTSWALSALVNHLWQSTLFAIAVWIAAQALRHNGARVRFWLWMAASAKFLIPLSLLMSVGQQFQWRDAPVAIQGTASFVVEEVLAPATTGVVALPPALPQSPPLLPWLLLAVWAAGAAVVLRSWWLQWVPIRSALRRAAMVRLDGQDEAANLMVMCSPSMPEPGVVGILRPRLILPSGIVERLTPAQLRALIVHERCHLRCHDNLTAAIHMVVEAIFWFHPVVWWIEARLVDERERACDEAVLQAGSRPQDYAEGILEVCRQSVGVRLACVAGVSGSNLRARVEAIMREEIGRPMTRRRQLMLAAVILATVGGPVAGGALTAQSQVVVPPALTFEAASIAPLSRLRDGGRWSRATLGPREVAMETRIQKVMLAGRGNGDVEAWGPLHSLIQVAYNVSDSQVEGGPSWVHTDSYAIKAKAADNATLDQMRGMLQSFLAERFKVTLRRETRILPVYDLVAADAGLKITPMREGECIPLKEIRWDLIDLEAPLYGCGSFRRGVLSQSPETRVRPRWPRVDRIEAGAISISAMIDLISGDLDRVVVDRTGFTAPFNLLLDFAAAAQPGSPFISSGPSIFEALEDQLGLQLLPAEAPLDVLVIESAVPPSDTIAGL
jgi:bla regulator protein BlaR1